MNMTRYIGSVTLIALTVYAAFPAGPEAASDIPVTTLVADYAADIAPILQIASDQQGAYRDSRTLSSLIQSIGDYVLDSYNPRGGARRLYLGFDQPIAGSGPNGSAPIPVPSGLYRVHLIAKCNAYGNSLFALAPGA